MQHEYMTVCQLIARTVDLKTRKMMNFTNPPNASLFWQKTRSAQTVKKKSLFPSPPESPKFHSNTTRNRSSVKEKLEKFLPNNENSKPFQTSTLDENSDLEKTSQILRPIQIPTLATRSVTGMVGLYNLGNTCYMNSIIQAMYMSQM